MFNNKILINILSEMADVIKENRGLLTDLDQAIGDGDHGINLDRGFSALKESLDSLKDKDCASILNSAAMVFISKVGGASGPLYGTAFMRAGKEIAGKENITGEDAINMFNAAIEGIMKRGKSDKGDKTMLDTLIPAFEAFKSAIENGDDFESISEKTLEAAKEGLEYTKTIAARKGRANYLGERSIGHQDPGATSSYLMLKVIADVLAKEL
ncbi:MAG: dihydroxyacetone kinase subunit L [Clostridiales bacterium]|nr:dihydroxyacetone kinase subunit L [Clostridiales bacterium]